MKPGRQCGQLCTCSFAANTENGWKMEKGGFCDHIDALMKLVHKATGLTCVKGTAHLPEGYVPEKL